MEPSTVWFQTFLKYLLCSAKETRAGLEQLEGDFWVNYPSNGQHIISHYRTIMNGFSVLE